MAEKLEDNFLTLNILTLKKGVVKTFFLRLLFYFFKEVMSSKFLSVLISLYLFITDCYHFTPGWLLFIPEINFQGGLDCLFLKKVYFCVFEFSIHFTILVVIFTFPIRKKILELIL